MKNQSMCLCLGISLCWFGYAEAAVKITSPTEGTTVAAGTTLHVVVTTDHDQPIGIVGPDPIGFTEIKKSPPYEFDIAIPAKIQKAGKINVSVATIGMVESDIVNIDLEKEGTPIKLQADPPRFIIGLREIPTVNQTGLPISVTASFADGTYVNVDESTHIQYTVRNPAIANIRNTLIYFPSTGSTVLDISYQGASISVPIEVRP
jgi:hypothetical protein